MYEVIFLLVLAFIWLLAASIQDIKKTEISDWLSFSLIIFALGFRFFWSLFGDSDFSFFYQGLIGFGIFFVIENLLYYGRLFAGGDAKLLMALGPILAFSKSFFVNLEIFAWFFVLFLFVGGFYGLIWSSVLAKRNFKNFKKEFYKQWNKFRKIIYFVLFFGLLIMLIGFFKSTFYFFIGIGFFICPYLYLFAKSVDESCMIKKVKTSGLIEGDWLYKNLRIGKTLINSKWEGLNKKEISLIQKKRRTVLIRTGIPYAPVFIISFLAFICFWFFWLGNSFW